MWIQNGLACNASHEKVKCVTPKVNLMNIFYPGDETRKQGSTLDLKPRADFTKSLKQEYQKGFMSPQILF